MVILFATAFAYVEAAVVVYLREIIYPERFAFPLKAIPLNLIAIELFRELATIVILATVALLSAKRFWERLGYFIIAFGVWDIFYYIWLKASIGWPSSLLDWDILFLIPLPWIGPVLAPVLISILMIICGVLITRLYAGQRIFHPGFLSWILAAIATAAILFSFMRDLDAGLNQQMPRPYQYTWLLAGLVLYLVGFVVAYRQALKRSV